MEIRSVPNTLQMQWTFSPPDQIMTILKTKKITKFSSVGVKFSALTILFFRSATVLHYLLMYSKVQRILEESIVTLTTGGV